jgi:hypothetical protein
VLAYEELDQLPADAATVYIDFAGNADLRRRIHSRFANLRYSCSVGGTHVEQLGGGKGLEGPRPVLFFAPAQAAKRIADWGAAQLRSRLVNGWQAFLARVAGDETPWLVAQHHRGPAALRAVYAQVLAGKGDPRRGHILSLSTA